MKNIDKESVQGKIIRALSMGLGVAVGLSNKKHSYKLSKEIIYAILGVHKRSSYLSSYFSKLRKQKIITIKEEGDNHVFILTEKGKNIVLKFNYESLEIKKPKIWDEMFRMVVFDIPERYKNARNTFREKIKEIGFVKFNDSVWVYPYPCQKEIDFVANYWKIGKYVHFVLVKEITKREELERFFDL